MKLNILSDLHLSCGALEMPRNDADIVILVGDIARPKDAVSWGVRGGLISCFGCTLAMLEAQRFMRDFSKIHVDEPVPRLFTPDDAAALRRADYAGGVQSAGLCERRGE